MNMKCISKLKKPGPRRILQQASSRKCKSIRVSPLESRVGTGCVNSPKHSASPSRNKINIPSFISKYVSRALDRPAVISHKRPVKTSSGHQRVYSDGQAAVANLPPDFSSGKILKKSGSQEKTLKKESSQVETEKTITREESKKKMFNTNDSDETIREKLIESIKESFRVHGTAPATTLDFYKIGRQIGNGAFGKVNLALNRLTGKKVAIKTIGRSFIRDERTRRKIFQEVFIMKKLRHKNIVRLLEVFEANNTVLIVLEYAGGGDLLNIIKARGRLTEDESRGIFYQLIDAVKTCHSLGIIHRDIKLDNILLTADFTEIKLCDFGVSRFAKSGEKVNEQCGTPAYLAPEIIADQGYEPFFVDIWSMGVLLYVMLSASVPFKAKNLPDLHKLILKNKYDIPEYFSTEAGDFIAKMLHPIPHLRISLQDMKKHSWFKGFVPNSEVDGVFNVERQNELLATINSFGFTREHVLQSLNLKDVNHATATYNLMEISEEC